MVCSAVWLCVQWLLLCPGAVDTTLGWSKIVGVRGPKAQPLILKFSPWGGGDQVAGGRGRLHHKMVALKQLFQCDLLKEIFSLARSISYAFGAM